MNLLKSVNFFLPPALLDAHPQVVLLGRTSGVVALALSESAQ